MAKKVAPLTPETGREAAWVWFKHEDDNIGPAGFTYKDQLLANGEVDPKTTWRKFDPNRKPDPWYRLGDVRARARQLGLEVRES
jgi:hypothetical protein